jgi:uncharacterized cupredoxin-like copper-binding protein
MVGIRSRLGSRRATSLWIPLMVLGLVALSCSKSEDAASTPSASTPSNACGSIAPAASGGVAATLHDFAIALGTSTGAAGSTTFNIVNLGPSVHELVVFKTDLALDKLPLDAEGTAVDEEGAGITHIDEVEDVVACTSQALTMDLEAGNYAVLCNITSHYGLGMRATFTVA